MQTQGGIQIALTVFVLSFPLLIAGSFFGILWHRPYVFYPPTEFGPQTDVGKYVEAMQRRPGLLEPYTQEKATLDTALEDKPATPADKSEEYGEPADIIVEVINRFVDVISTAGLVALYACYLAHAKAASFEGRVLVDKLQSVTFEYAHGTVITTSSASFIEITVLKGIWNVTFMHEILKERIPLELGERLNRYEEEGVKGEVEKKTYERVLADKKMIEEYFG